MAIDSLKCTVCGGSLVMDDSGEFAICEMCGMKFKKETIKKMIGELAGFVKTEASTEKPNLPKCEQYLPEDDNPKQVSEIAKQTHKKKKTKMQKIIALIAVGLTALLVVFIFFSDSKTKRELSAISQAKLGDTVTFGTYEQDNNTKNGQEAIEWLVLEKSGYQALLISKVCLDAKPYHDRNNTDITWQDCSLRKWLNDSFMNMAFSSQEQEQIALTKLSNPDNEDFELDIVWSSGGNDTSDKIFLLNIDEAKQYFAKDAARGASATAYAKSQGGADISINGNSNWWLRSPGGEQNEASYITERGLIKNYFGLGDVYQFTYAIRPALRINLKP